MYNVHTEGGAGIPVPEVGGGSGGSASAAIARRGRQTAQKWLLKL